MQKIQTRPSLSRKYLNLEIDHIKKVINNKKISKLKQVDLKCNYVSQVYTLSIHRPGIV